MSCAARFRVSSCSQMRSTRQPERRRPRFTRASRAALAASLAVQKAALPAGRVPCSGQPCQKQPSTKTASRGRANTKSGRTVNAAVAGRPPARTRSRTWRRQPVMPSPRKTRASAPSVRALPRDRIRDITADRFAGVKMSATGGS